jgi:general stress protein CsbA
MFLFAVVVVSIVAGMMLMQAINNYKNQEEVDAATSTLIRPPKR